MGQTRTGQRTRAVARPGQAGRAPWRKGQHPLRCLFGLGTVRNRALCLLGKVPLGLCRRAGEGLRSAPAGGAQQQPTPAGGVPAFRPAWPDAGWVLGTHWEPPWCCQCGGQEGLCATLQPIADSSRQPAGPSRCVAGRERLWFVQLIHFTSRSIQSAFPLSPLSCKVKMKDAAVHIK